MRVFMPIIGMILCLLIGMVSNAQQFGSLSSSDYESVAESQTNQTLGPIGGKGDLLDKLVIVPQSTSAGSVSIKDGSDTAIFVFKTGTLSNLATIVVPLNARSRTGAWQVTTGASVGVIGIGKFK